METTRRWFSKFKANDKMKPSKNKEAAGVTKDGSKPPTNEEVPSDVTKQKVEAAKHYIENHYKKQMQSLQERKERYIYFNLYIFGMMTIQSNVIEEL